jgi:predicted amidohydrolase
MIVTLRSQLEEARSLLDLSTKLGRVCLEHGGQLLALTDAPTSRPITKWIEEAVEADAEQWAAAAKSEDAGTFLDSSSIGPVIELAEARHPVGHLAVLRGLCRKALPLLFAETVGQIVLDRGTPVPIATRPLPEIIKHSTPNPSTTLTTGHLLERRGFKLFEYAAGGLTQVVLDYAYRRRIDEIAWTGEKRLPRIATLHPFLGARTTEIGTEQRTTFFDVNPRDWNAVTVLEKLRSLADVPIAVLPELCLPIADALEEALAEDHESYPALVVAGSAHVREAPADNSGAEVRANECRIYLDGRLVAVHRKIHPFMTRHLAGHDLPEPSKEDLTTEIKRITVLSGDHTRFAVVLCADLNDESIPLLLEGAGVNLLLVPAMTNGAGAFTGAVCGLASRCQAVALVVNGDLDANPSDDGVERPFLVLAAVPRPDPEEQSCRYPAEGEARSYANVIDPNERLMDARKGA